VFLSNASVSTPNYKIAHQLARRERELAKILKLSDGIDLEAVQIGKQ